MAFFPIKRDDQDLQTEKILPTHSAAYLYGDAALE